MSATSGSSTTDVDSTPNNSNKPPLVSALFLIKFDLKVGYTVAWKRCVTDILLEGNVEFKSLPSGLHSVKNDLVYFVHEGYAGLSAFVNGPAEEAERNAHLVAVGILVPLSYGRLGRSWLHAHSLLQLATVLVDNTTLTAPLEEFWEQYRIDQNKRAPNSKSPTPSSSSANKSSSWKAHNRSRALSSVTAVLPSEQYLSSWHPALSILKYIDIFGPLIFPLQRAALLRKRILFLTSAPVRQICEFVYDLSILSGIPASVSDLVAPESDAIVRLRSLFAVGVHDIPLLEKATGGWIACTTDEIIETKKNIYDIIVKIPRQYEQPPLTRQWPTITTSQGGQVKASQRDLRRFKLLHHKLFKIRNCALEDIESNDETDDNTALLPPPHSGGEDEQSDDGYDDKLIEPMTWSQLAYAGFMWWASAGEKDAFLQEEQDRDRELLGDLSDFLPARMGGQSDEAPSYELVQAGLHTAIIAYFHRLTSTMIKILSGIVEAADDDSDREGDEEMLVVDRDDIIRLGLDAWNESDKAFIGEFLSMYYGRQCEVHGASLECCGVKIC